MKCMKFVGLDGSNPLGFLSALGLLRLVRGAGLAFSTDGSFQALLRTDMTPIDIVSLVLADAETASAANGPPWRLTYTKAATKKQGPHEVADLKAPPSDFKKLMRRCLDCWLAGDNEAAAYAAAFGTDVAVDGNGNTKPTAFHFTAANQTFLGLVEQIRASLTREWIEAALFRGHAEKSGSNLRWDPGSERNWALMANNPNEDGTRVNAPLEWLAFRGLPMLPSFPSGTRVVTTCVFGRGGDMTFRWPLWSVPASVQAVRSALQLKWTQSATERLARGVFATCSSEIRRTSQGFGNFGPSLVTC